MLTNKQQSHLIKAVLKRVRELEPEFIFQYEGVITPWLMRIVIECYEVLKGHEEERREKI